MHHRVHQITYLCVFKFEPKFSKTTLSSSNVTAPLLPESIDKPFFQASTYFPLTSFQLSPSFSLCFFNQRQWYFHLPSAAAQIKLSNVNLANVQLGFGTKPPNNFNTCNSSNINFAEPSLPQYLTTYSLTFATKQWKEMKWKY